MDNYTQGLYCRDTIHPGHGNYSGSNTLTFSTTVMNRLHTSTIT